MPRADLGCDAEQETHLATDPAGQSNARRLGKPRPFCSNGPLKAGDVHLYPERRMSHEFVKFLGTAGARFVVAKQLRYSAGTFLALAGQKLMLDPGPGTLLRCAKSRPPIDASNLDAVLLTHAHIDHSGDVNALLDAMTSGGFKRRGAVFAPQECLEGDNAVVLKYLRESVEQVVVLEPERRYQIGSLDFCTSVRHQHSVETYGIKFERDGQTIGFLVDTLYFEGLAEAYKDSDILVINVVRHQPHKSGTVMHLALDDARLLIEQIRPRKAVLTHYGMTMLKAKPRLVAQRLAEELGIQVIAASDGMTLDLEEP